MAWSLALIWIKCCRSESSKKRLLSRDHMEWSRSAVSMITSLSRRGGSSHANAMRLYRNKGRITDIGSVSGLCCAYLTRRVEFLEIPAIDCLGASHAQTNTRRG